MEKTGVGKEGTECATFVKSKEQREEGEGGAKEKRGQRSGENEK